MVLWTELSNLFSVESDCPHREKFGYGGDIVAAGEMAMLNFDMSRFYAKAVQDLADAVRPNGGFTETAPFVGISDEGLGDNSGPVGWGTAHPFLLWRLYQYYGDKRLLEENYEPAKALDRTAAVARAGRHPGQRHQRSREPGAEAARVDRHGLLLFQREAVRTASHGRSERNPRPRKPRRWPRPSRPLSTASFSNRARAGMIRPRKPARRSLSTWAWCPPRNSDRALAVLVRDIEDAHAGHLTTGIFGTKFMLHALADAGRADVAYRIVNQSTFPGWGYMLENGATTLWEHWEFSDNTYSHNHPMFGSVSEWFYKVLAGINAAPDAVGFDKIIIRPQPVGDLQWVKASYDSVHGKVVSEWSREAGTVQAARAGAGRRNRNGDSAV